MGRQQTGIMCILIKTKQAKNGVMYGCNGKRSQKRLWKNVVAAFFGGLGTGAMLASNESIPTCPPQTMLSRYPRQATQPNECDRFRIPQMFIHLFKYNALQ